MDEKDDLRSTIETAFNESVEPALESEVIADVTENVADTTEPKERDEKGKFAKVEKEPEVALVEPNQPIEPVIEKIAAPKSLKKELVDKYWDSLDQEMQKAIVQREEDSAKGFEPFKQHAEFGKNVESAIMPYMATINQFGAKPHEAIKELFSVDHVLRYGQPHEKVGMMQRIFRDYGINPQTVFDSITQQTPQIDPALAPVYQELQGLKAQQQQWLSQQQQRENEMLLNEVMTFSEGKEHISAVQDEMMALLPQIVQSHPHISYQEKLQKAYDMAIWAKPDLRESLLQQEREKATKQIQTAAQAQRSAAASVSVKGSSPASTSAQPDNLRDLIASQFT